MGNDCCNSVLRENVLNRQCLGRGKPGVAGHAGGAGKDRDKEPGHF